MIGSAQGDGTGGAEVGATVGLELLFVVPIGDGDCEDSDDPGLESGMSTDCERSEGDCSRTALRLAREILWLERHCL